MDYIYSLEDSVVSLAEAEVESIEYAKAQKRVVNIKNQMEKKSIKI